MLKALRYDPAMSQTTHATDVPPGYMKRGLKRSRSLGVESIARRIGPLAAVAAIIATTLALVVTRLSIPRYYLNSDSGHYLADSDALFGHGVRELRHAPLFPFLVGLTRLLVTDDLLAIKVSIAFVVALLVGCFYFFIRGRTGSMPGDLAATGLFALAPTTAEAVGWFGGASLLGIALSLIALRLIADLLADPAVWRSVAAALAVAGVVLSHPFSVGFLFETTVAYLAFRLVRQVIRSRSLAPALKPRLRTMGLLGIAVLGGLLALATARKFYDFIQNPLSVAPAPHQLDQIWAWAFRDDPFTWLVLLGASVLIVPLAHRTAGERGLDMGLAVTALNAIALLNMTFLQGNLSYVTRNLYFTPIAIAATLGVGATAMARAAAWVRPRSGAFRAFAAGAPIALVVLVAAPATLAFADRLDVAVPYYNTIDAQELAAIEYLTGRAGTVILTPRGTDLDAGRQYAWMIEGLARDRALGSGLATFNIAAIAGAETADAERFAAGPAVVEDGRLRAAFDGTARSHVKVFGDVNGTWYHLIDIDPHAPRFALSPAIVSTNAAKGNGEISSSNTPGDPPATLRLDGADHKLHVSLPATQLGPDGQVDIVPAAASGEYQVTGSGFAWQTTLEGKSITITVHATDETGAPSLALVTSQGAALRSSAPGHPLAIDVHVAGVTESPVSMATFTQARLIHDQGIRYLWTWRTTNMVDELALRSCLTLAYENNEVAIFSVDGNCHA
jgi:hypothetical protein